MRGVRAKKSRKNYNLNLNLQNVYTNSTCVGFDIWEKVEIAILTRILKKKMAIFEFLTNSQRFPTYKNQSM